MTEKLEKLERRERTNRQNSERTIKQTEKPTTKKKNRNNQKVKIVITLTKSSTTGQHTSYSGKYTCDNYYKSQIYIIFT